MNSDQLTLPPPPPLCMEVAYIQMIFLNIRPLPAFSYKNKNKQKKISWYRSNILYKIYCLMFSSHAVEYSVTIALMMALNLSKPARSRHINSSS